MATILKEANFKGKNGSHFKIRLSYDLSQSQANNTSTIKYYLYMISMDGYSGSGATAKGYINGEQVGTFTSIGVNTTKQIGTKSTTVTHNNDGTKSVSYSASVDTSWSLGDASLSGTLTLPKINRLATVTSASNFTDEENPTLSFSNPAGFTVYPYLNFYDNNNNLVYQLYRNSETITSPYTWNITGEERSALWRATNKQQTYKVTVGVDTYNGTTKLGNNSKAQTMTYVNAEPSATYTLTEENAKVSALITSVSSIVENTSQIKVSVTPTVLKEATIKNVILTNGANEISKSSSPYEYTFNIQSSNVFRIKVIDSRNNTKEYTITKTLINYQPVSINSFKFKRENPTSSNIYLTADITYYQTTFGTTTNAPTIKYKKGESGTLRTLTASDYTLDNTNHKITITDKKLVDTLPYNQEQTFYLYVEDKLSTATDSRGITKGIPTFDAGSHDFQVNGDLFVADVNRQNKIDASKIIRARNEAIVIGLSSDITINPTVQYQRTKLNLSLEMGKLGDKLTLTNGEVKVGKGISKIRVSANGVLSGSTQLTGIIVAKNGDDTYRTFTGSSHTSFLSCSISGGILDVNENDLISLYVYTNTATESRTVRAYDGYATYLCVEAVY